MKPLLPALLFLATPLHAESIKYWSYKSKDSDPPSYVELHEPKAPNAVATVTFLNDTVHSTDEKFDLTYDGLTVTFLFDWQFDGTHDERLTVLPPEGYVAVPSEVIVPEGDTATIHIYKWEGM